MVQRYGFLCTFALFYNAFIMKKPILLVLIYLGIQLGVGILENSIIVLYKLIFKVDLTPYNTQLLSASLVLSMAVMLIVLKHYHRLPMDRKRWSFVSWPYLLLTLVLALSFIPLMDGVSSLLKWMPDLLKGSFDNMSGGFFGIIAMTLIGPVFEEVLFRGAVTDMLLARYSPAKAIFFSALIFGVFHLNPAQIIPAMLGGLVLATLYYRTGSLVPGILVHICINGSSVLFQNFYKNADSLSDIMNGRAYVIVLIDAVFFFLAASYLLKRITDKKINKPN